MNKLETTLISLARQRLSDVLAFHAAQHVGPVTDEEIHEFAGNHGALFAFLELWHFASGLSAEATEALEAIEGEYTAALRSLPSQPAPAMPAEPHALLDISQG